MNNNGQNLDPNINWQAILLHLKKQKLVPFLGAGASMGFGGSTGLRDGSGRALSFFLSFLSFLSFFEFRAIYHLLSLLTVC